MHGGRNKRGDQLNDLWAASLDSPNVDWDLLNDGSDTGHAPEPRKGHTATMRPGPAAHLVSPLLAPSLSTVLPFRLPSSCILLVSAHQLG